MKAATPAPPSAPAPAPIRSRLIAAVLITAAVFAAHGSSLGVPFLFDDQTNITDNPYIRLTSLAPGQLYRAMVQDRNQLRPVSNLTFGLDYLAHGLDPRLMHLENIALHAATSLLLFALLLRLLPTRPPAASRRTTAAAIAAAAWALSPANTQAVTYLVQRHTLMATALTLASSYCWVRARQEARRRTAWFAGAALAFILAAASKESGFLAPGFWLLLELFSRSGTADRADRRRLAAAGGVVTAGAVALGWALAATGMLDGFVKSYRELGYGPVARLATEARVVLSYLATIILPLPSRLMLDHEVIVSTGPCSPWTTAPSVAAVVAALVLALAWSRRRPAWSACAVGFLFSLSPEATVIPVELMNDHRMYLAGMFVVPPLAALAVLGLPVRRSVPVAVVALTLLGLLTGARNRAWQDPVRLWADSAAKSPSLYRPWSNLCSALTAEKEFLRALPACDAAIARNPPGPVPMISRGIARTQLGMKEEAGRDFAEAVRRWPGDPAARFNFGAYLFGFGDGAAALAEVSRALELDPFLAPAYLLRARIHRQNGEEAKARADLEFLLRLYPEHQQARRMLDPDR